jgi:H+-transporting ATPase
VKTGASTATATAASGTLPCESLEDLYSSLDTGPNGINEDDAARRLERDGPNALEEERSGVLRRLVSYFWGPIPLMIGVAALLSAIVAHWLDFGVILTLMFANVAVGFWEEYQAGNVVEALNAKLALFARVKRSGRWRKIPSRELVLGDVIRLRLGDIVPADARLIEGEPLEVDQSALTGESLPASRGGADTIYSGSIVKKGEGDAVVCATGEHTYFGKTASLAREARTESRLQRAVIKIADFLIAIAVALVAIIVVVALFRGDPKLQTLQFAMVLTVAAIPVAMPTVLSVTMAVGARMLAARESVVTHLASIEELAGVDVICSDKTGTLTQNKLTLGPPACLGGHAESEVIRCAALASRAEDQDPIDMAVLTGVKDGEGLKGFEIVRFSPFDPVSKRTEAEVKGPDGHTFHTTKGAPQVILSMAGDAGGARAEAESRVEDFAGRGYRTIGVARSEDGKNWTLLGLLPLFDPPREDSAATVASARDLGISLKMITGDQMAIAKETASQVGIGANIMDSSALENVRPHDTGRLADGVENADGFAQVFPEHKYRVVELLEERGHVVGMTGDGVNDAPALRKANVGVAVSGATDAARAAADIVLLAPGLSVIIEAVRLSRRIFERMNNYAIYRITETIRILIFMALSIMIFNFYPVTAVMIVLLALLNDGAILSIAYDNVAEHDRPLAWNMQVVLGVATSLGLLGVIETFLMFYLADRVFMLDRDTIRSLMFIKLAVAGHLTYFVARTRGPFWSRRPAGIVLGAVLGTQTVSTLITVYGVFMAPIGWAWAGFVWAYCLTWFLLEDLVKRVSLRLFDNTRPGVLSPLYGRKR